MQKGTSYSFKLQAGHFDRNSITIISTEGWWDNDRTFSRVCITTDGETKFSQSFLFDIIVYQVVQKIHATRCLFHMKKILSILLSRARYRISIDQFYFN